MRNEQDIQELRQKISLLLIDAMKQVLLLAQAALPESQYSSFRKLIMDCFGKRGLERQIVKIVEDFLDRAGAKKQN